MGKKIMKIIEDCSDCEFSKEYQECNGNTSFVLICNYEVENDEKIEKNPFLLHQSSQKPRHYRIEIPNNCPLEDYEK